MATIVGAARSSVARTGRTDSAQLTFPAISGTSSGDTAYLFVGTDAAGTTATPSGWTTIFTNAAVAADYSIHSRTITSDSDYTSIDASFVAGRGWNAFVLIVSGTHTLEASQDDNDSADVPYVPSIASFSSGDLSVVFGVADDQQVLMSPPPDYALFDVSGTTEGTVDYGNDGADQSSAGLAYKVSSGGTEGEASPSSATRWTGASNDGTSSFHIRFSGIDDPAGGGAVTGTSAATLPSITTSASGGITKTGTGAAALPSITANAAGSAGAIITGSGAPALPSITASGAGERTITGAGAPSLPPVTASAAGTRSITGSASPSLPAVTSAADGDVLAFVDGDAAASIPALEAAALGVVNPIRDESGDILLDESGNGIQESFQPVTVAGSASATLPAVTASAAGVRTVAGQAAVDMPVPSITADGSSGIGASGSVSLPSVAVSASGTIARSGSGAITLPSIEVSGAGGFVLEGSGAADLPAATVSATGVVTQIAGRGAVTLPGPTTSGSISITRKGSAAVTLPRARANVRGGLQISGSAAVTLPAVRVLGRDKAVRRTDLLVVWATGGPDDRGGETFADLSPSTNDLTLYGGSLLRGLLDESSDPLLDESSDPLTLVEAGAPAGAVVDLDVGAPNAVDIDQRGANIVVTDQASTQVDV